MTTVLNSNEREGPDVARLHVLLLLLLLQVPLQLLEWQPVFHQIALMAKVSAHAMHNKLLLLSLLLLLGLVPL
jgi:hypothetical protein